MLFTSEVVQVEHDQRDRRLLGRARDGARSRSWKARWFQEAGQRCSSVAHRATLERQAQTDPLTGLWNHRAFHERLRDELVSVSTEQTSVALIMLDLDDFKRVNDIYSHATGDHVLSQVASILLGSVRGSDSVCRIGGEEFAIIAPTRRSRTPSGSQSGCRSTWRRPSSARSGQ